MMAAVQPFISGAISKTVNMPEASTPEEIAQVYVDGWKLGLKAIAVYRDNSKRSQPLNTKKDDGKGNVADAVAPEVQTVFKPLRRRLPDERASITHKFNVGGHEGYLTIGLYEDGTPGEIFLRMAKEGSTISGLMDSFATAVSLALQYGVPLEGPRQQVQPSPLRAGGLHDQPGHPDGQEPGRLHLPVHGHEVHVAGREGCGWDHQSAAELVGGEGGEWGGGYRHLGRAALRWRRVRVTARRRHTDRLGSDRFR